MKKYNNPYDYILTSLEFFAGMEPDEIRAYIDYMTEIENIRWRKEWDAKMEREREDDRKYLETAINENQPTTPLYPVEIDDCVRVNIPPGSGKQIFITRQEFERSSKFFRFRFAGQENGNAFYLPRDIRAWENGYWKG